jgi:hypothetical protein
MHLSRTRDCTAARHLHGSRDIRFGVSELCRDGVIYLDIVQFRSREDMDEVMKLEMESEVYHAFFAVMDLSAEADAEIITSLATYDKP